MLEEATSESRGEIRASDRKGGAEAIAHGRKLLLEIGGNSEESWQQNDRTFENAAPLADALARVVGYPEYDEESGRYAYPDTPSRLAPSDEEWARWSLRVLDAHGRALVAKHGAYHSGCDPSVLQLSNGGFTVSWWGSAAYSVGEHRTEDAARIAAAKALRATDDSLPAPPAQVDG
jgi:hypothetical protein